MHNNIVSRNGSRLSCELSGSHLNLLFVLEGHPRRHFAKCSPEPLPPWDQVQLHMHTAIGT